MKFKDKVCIVTGGANGIGRCIAEAFLLEGAKVAIIDTDSVSGNILAGQHPNDLSFFHGDIADRQILEAFAQNVLAKYGAVDFLVNNACISKKGILSGCSYDDFTYVLRIGVSAPYYLACLFAAHFAHGGAIVNISSTRSSMSQPDTESYSAAKGGVSALTHALCISLSGKVRVNSISPGWIETGAFQHESSFLPRYAPADEAQQPSGRVGNPYDIAQAVLYLCGSDAGFINGENITIDGGMSKQMIYHGEHGWTYNK